MKIMTADLTTGSGKMTAAAAPAADHGTQFGYARVSTDGQRG